MEYLLKASGIIALFYTIYFLFLRKETFFKINRFFLLSGLLLALVIPKIAIPIYIEYTPIEVSNLFIENTVAPSIASPKPIDTGLNFLDYALILYLVGVAFFLIRFIIQLFSLATIIIKNKNERQGKYLHVITSGNISPFSFFNWMVYNPKQFNESELEQIITHEKVHVNQLHSIDVLVVQLMSIFLWFNPFIHLYSKNLKQNLEFLADNTALNSLNSKKAYQYILLKTSAKNHQLALSNNFYNSFIKKRIVMLHKSRSKRINKIKYVFVIPLLALFLMSFNTEEIYIEKKSNTKNYKLNTNTSQNNIDTYHILDNFKDTDFEEMKKLFKTKGYTLKISNLKRVKGLITAITIDIKNKTTNANFNKVSLLPIKAIKIVLDKDKNIISIGNLSDTDWKAVSGFPSQEKAAAYKNSKKLGNFIPENDLDKALFVLDGKIVEQKEIQNLNVDDINSMHVLKEKKAIEKYGDEGKDGVIEITTNTPIFKQNNRLVFSDSILFIEKNSKDQNKSNDDPVMIGRSDSGIIIKGISDKNGKTPLIFLDGKEITEKEMRAITPDSINEMKVLKGEKAIKKYGEEGKNGVIELTTKGKTKSINGRPLDSTKVIGYAKSQDSDKTIKVKSPWKVSKGTINQEKDDVLSSASVKTINLYDGKNPVYLVNGIAISKDEFSKLDTEQIHSVTILKDEKATSYFGDIAKDNVIMIQKKESRDLDNGEVIIATETKNPGNIMIRDTGKNKPLVIVDGKERKGRLKKINPSDIEKINVLKGESAIEKYGEKGKNGVVEITSKNKSKWKAEKSRNINIIYATKDTIYVHKKPDIIREFASDLKKTPLFIVDGKEISKKEFIAIDPFDVERISVIKPEQVNLDEYGEKGKNGVVKIKLRTEKSNTPFIKVVGDAKFIVDGIEVSSEAFYKISPEQIKSVVATSSSNGESTIKVSTKKKK